MAPDHALVESESILQEPQFTADSNKGEVNLEHRHATDIMGDVHDEHKSTSVNRTGYETTHEAAKDNAANIDIILVVSVLGSAYVHHAQRNGEVTISSMIR